MRVLVTGGAGYIGSQTAKALAKSGHEVVVLDNLATGHRETVKWGPFVEGDLGDKDLLTKIFKERRIEAVLHFAASLLVGESVKNPQKYFWNNVVNTLHLLDVMKAFRVKRIVFSSSAAVYGNPEKLPIPEDHSKAPVNPYGESKLCMERAIHWYGIAYGLRGVALRYFNAAGADLEGELGEEHDPESHLIPLVVKAALGYRTDVEIYGTDYPTPDGTAIRDYIHVVDLADAHVRALEYLADGGESMELNLGTGEGHSVREVVTEVGKLCDGRVPSKDAPRRTGDPAVLVADPSRARKVLHWYPRYSELGTIIQSAWKWNSSKGR
ncbi:MAG: UDP-glucose 4-epimerase GalE [Acidobacteria bacterium]|nr:MAG: UDP-glucose 4-epimerase GalE [Acidobacteriota bacterium]